MGEWQSLWHCGCSSETFWFPSVKKGGRRKACRHCQTITNTDLPYLTLLTTYYKVQSQSLFIKCTFFQDYIILLLCFLKKYWDKYRTADFLLWYHRTVRYCYIPTLWERRDSIISHSDPGYNTCTKPGWSACMCTRTQMSCQWPYISASMARD